MIFFGIWLQISPDVFSGIYKFHFTVINLFSAFFTRETLIAWKKSWVLIQIQLASGPQENEEVLHPNIFQQILILWHFSLRYFIFSWRFYNAAWIFQNQFRKFWFHILSRATLPYLELSKCQIENRAPSDQNILSHFYWKKYLFTLVLNFQCLKEVVLSLIWDDHLLNQKFSAWTLLGIVTLKKHK